MGLSTLSVCGDVEAVGHVVGVAGDITAMIGDGLDPLSIIVGVGCLGPRVSIKRSDPFLSVSSS
jgi:hypothetical protein